MEEQVNSIIERKIIWQEIKALEREFKRNQEKIKGINEDNTYLIKQLGEKLNRIQELAEKFDVM
ncbi:MAG TPA: hypothetical protein VN922_16680 [Bacteroidia bacterium]|nr:hypothetical protein [Bacteroidia bacterium]